MRSARWTTMVSVALGALVLSGLATAPSATASAESRARAEATAAKAERVVTELKRLRSQGAGADPAAVRAAGADLQRVTGDARSLLQDYLAERGPVGNGGESATVVVMNKRINTGRVLVRQMTGVNAVPKATKRQRNRFTRRTAQLVRAAARQRAAELGIGDVFKKGPERALQTGLERRARRFINREASNILVEATAASLVFGTPTNQEVDLVIREKASGLLAKAVLNLNPLQRIALSLIGADRILDRAVKKVVPVVAWGPRQIVRFIRRISRPRLGPRARRSTKGLLELADSLRKRSNRAGTTAKQATAFVRWLERAQVRAVNLREELARAGRVNELRANTKALRVVRATARDIRRRFGLDTELFLTRRALRNGLVASEREIAAMLGRWDGTVRIGSGGMTGPGGGGAMPAGRATQASCLSPIEIATPLGPLASETNTYAVTGAQSEGLGIVCQYTRTDDPSRGGPSLGIEFGPSSGRCADPSPDPVPSNARTWHSTRRTISVALLWGGSWTLIGPEGWYANVVRAAEAEGAGELCPRVAPR